MMIATSLFSQEYIDLSLPSGTLWATYDIGCTFEGDMSGTEFCTLGSCASKVMISLTPMPYNSCNI